MGFVQNRVARDASTPPSLYGAVGLEAAVSGAARWNDGVDVAIVGGGITGLWTAWHLAAQGSRVAVLEAHQIGHGASGHAFGQLVPYLKHSHRKIVADLGAGRSAVARGRRRAGGDRGLHRAPSDRLRGDAQRHPDRRQERSRPALAGGDGIVAAGSADALRK